ncbi:MAG: hypothetical protein H0X46_06735 [Bacteroidetes bacterium]|nr:hypothetical protein [Bacteroidota bacterium]
MKKNLILGIAAGAAAVVVLTILQKRTGMFDNLMDKIRDLADTVEDKFSEMERGQETIIPKGEDRNVTSQMPHHN